MEMLLNNSTIQDQDDPNRLWVDIDRGIRSKEPHRQFEAILKMPALFKTETTSTSLISAAFIKLATLFQEGTNEMRLNVTKVLDRLAHHLQKSSTLDEPIQQIYLVMHSNDCIARALTLRTLAILAHILADDVEAHLHIRSALDSNDEIEVLAAVKAAKKFIPCSKTFAISISTKLVSLVEDLTTPLTMKSWLIPLFEHMTHDATVSMKGRQLLISLISKDTTEEFLRVAIPTLARLAVKSHIEIGETVTFFLNFLQHEPRQSCRKLILEHLIPIARCGSIVWLDSTTNNLIQYANECDDDYIRLQIFRVLEALISHGVYLSSSSIKDLKQLLEKFTIYTNLQVAYQCCSTTLRLILKYRTNLTVTSPESPEKRSRDHELVLSAKTLDELIEHLDTALAFLLTETIDSNRIKELKNTLHLIEQLSRAHQPSAQSFIHLLFITCANIQNPDLLSDLTVSLVRLSTHHIQMITNETCQLRHLLAHTSLNDTIRYNLLALFVLSNPNNINDIHEHIEQLSAWKCFLLARWCIRHCLYKIARDLLEMLTKCVQTAIHRIWLDTLIDLCQAEERLQANINLSKADDAMDDDQNYSYLERLCENLAEAGSFYESSLIKMPTRLLLENDSDRLNGTNFDFERAYCDVRSSIIHQFYEMIHTIHQYDLGLISYELLGKRMLTMVGKRFTSISSKIDDIQQSCFDGDTQTLWCLSYNRFLCDLMSTLIDRLIRNHPVDKTVWLNRLNEISYRDGFTESIFNQLVKIVEFTCTRLQQQRKSSKKSISIDEELGVLQYLASSAVMIAIPVPRMFFQRLQQTVVQLVVSPNENEDRPVHESDALLPVQIHGEISATYHRLPLRTVKQVFVEVLTNQEMTKKNKNKVISLDQITHDDSYRGAKASLFSADSSHSKPIDHDNDHYETVILNEELKDNRFHAGFILHLGSVTNYNIHIRVSFEDDDGQRWTNVAEKMISIKLNNRRQTRTTTGNRSHIPQIRPTTAT